ncbi:thioredoxin-like domain-containing protein [Sinomicrobium sp.]
MNKIFKKYIQTSVGCLFLLGTLIGCSRSGFVVHGNIPELKNGTVALKVIDGREVSEVLDSTEVKDGVFVLKGEVDSPVMALLEFSEGAYMTTFFIENSEISIKGNIDRERKRPILNIEVEGSVVDQAHRDMISSIYDEPEARLEKLRNKYEQTTDTVLKKQLKHEVDSLSRNFRSTISQRRRDYIRNNLNSPVAAYALSNEMSYDDTGVDELADIFSKLPKSQISSPYYSEAAAKLKSLEALEPGGTPPSFSLIGVNGEELSLDALKGKVVIVDFWASWCIPCRQSFPHLKELYNAYKEKGFEIITVSVDRDKKAWMNALEKDQLPWLNTHSFFPEQNKEQQMEQRYAVNHYPKTYLIDKEGKVVAKDVNHEFVENYLKSQFEL